MSLKEFDDLYEQLDRLEKCLNQLHRMLKWVILDRCNDTVKEHYRKYNLPDKDLEGALWKKPDISDILDEKDKAG